MYDIENNGFSEKMKFYRKSRNMTLEELGKIINKTKATYQNMKKEK